MASFGVPGSEAPTTESLTPEVSVINEQIDEVDFEEQRNQRIEHAIVHEAIHEEEIAEAEAVIDAALEQEGLLGGLDYDQYITDQGIDIDLFTAALDQNMQDLSLEEQVRFLQEQIDAQPDLIHQKQVRLAELKLLAKDQSNPNREEDKAAYKLLKDQLKDNYPQFGQLLMDILSNKGESSFVEKKEEVVEKKEEVVEKKEEVVEKKEERSIIVSNTEALNNRWQAVDSAKRVEEIPRILEEFKDKTGVEDMLDALEKFQASLQLPQNTPEKDQERVISIFNNFENISLDQEGIATFCTAIQEDQALSVETKRHVLSTMGVESTITTGDRFNRAVETQAVQVDPETGEETMVNVYTENNRLEMQGGIQAYVNEQGEKVMVLPGQDNMEIKLRTMNAQENNSAREQLRVAFAFNAMPEEMIYALFPEHQVGERNKPYDERTIKRVNDFMRALLPLRMTEANYIPNNEDMSYFRDAVNALTHNKSMGKVEMIRDLEQVGVLENGPGTIDFPNINEIGIYLRANDYNQNRSFAFGGDAAFDDMVQRFGPENDQEKKSKKRGGLFRRWRGNADLRRP